jgi:hypothetical protein
MATKRTGEPYRKPLRDGEESVTRRGGEDVRPRDEADTSGHMKRGEDAAKRIPDDATALRQKR